MHEAVVANVQAACERLGLAPRGCIPSPIKGASSGNKEFLAHFVLKGADSLTLLDRQPPRDSA